MKSSTKDQVEGTLHEITRKVKEAAGHVTNNPDLTNEGQAEELAGKVQQKVSDEWPLDEQSSIRAVYVVTRLRPHARASAPLLQAGNSPESARRPFPPRR
jgi:uncharacterized protein YjbJ (UPF0337 family)